MRDVDDVEHAECDRNSDRHGNIEAAEQHARNNGVDQKLEGEIHALDARRQPCGAMRAAGRSGGPMSGIHFPRGTFSWLLASSMALPTRQCANWPGGAADFTLRNLPSGPVLWNLECLNWEAKEKRNETDDLAGHGRGLRADACRNRVGAAAAAAAAAGTRAAARAARESRWQHADAEGARRRAAHDQRAG